LSSPLDLIEELDHIERLIVCDACEAPLTIGELRLWIWPTNDLQRTRSSSSHHLGLIEALTLAETLQRLPPIVEIWGIGAAESRPASEPSPPVRAACRQLATQLAKEFARA
jgi:hydrogenase maturation protease